MAHGRTAIFTTAGARAVVALTVAALLGSMVIAGSLSPAAASGGPGTGEPTPGGPDAGGPGPGAADGSGASGSAPGGPGGPTSGPAAGDPTGGPGGSTTVGGPGNGTTPPPCPLVFGHGGYPSGPDARTKDLIRQPNNYRGVDDQKAWGADGVEADVQLTKDGAKAVMWHNATTNGLTGPRTRITDMPWDGGADDLRSRRISRGPYAGERVYTLREWLDHVRTQGLVALLEIKPEAEPILRDPARSAPAWQEISEPILERQALQPILVYSRNPWIQSELALRHPALLRGSAATWTDGVAWDEPPPAWTLNAPRWQTVLDQAPGSVMTSHTREYRAWLSGRCVPGTPAAAQD